MEAAAVALAVLLWLTWHELRPLAGFLRAEARLAWLRFRLWRAWRRVERCGCPACRQLLSRR